MATTSARDVKTLQVIGFDPVSPHEVDDTVELGIAGTELAESAHVHVQVGGADVPEPRPQAALSKQSERNNIPESKQQEQPNASSEPVLKSILKPSQIVELGEPVQRETGRMTGEQLPIPNLPNPNEILARPPSTVCCCINPYIDEEPSVHGKDEYYREGDIHKHQARFERMVVCFNVCYSHEFVSKTIITRAADGAIIHSVTVDDLNNLTKYFMVKSEKCRHRHHDLKRYSNCGRILTFLCTFDGIVSTLRKLICLDDCVDTVNVRTLRCERTLYSKRNFKI